MTTLQVLGAAVIFLAAMHAISQKEAKEAHAILAVLGLLGLVSPGLGRALS
jgi:hypothetical protein